MSTQSYLPRGDEALLVWTANLSARVNLDPAAVGLSPADAATLSDALAVFRAELDRATRPETRTILSVASKNTAREILSARVRAVVRKVRAFEPLTAEQCVGLGLRLPAGRGLPVVAPGTPPVIMPISAFGLEQHLRILDRENPRHRSRPAGTIGAEIYTRVGDDPGQHLGTPEDLRGWESQGIFTRGRARLHYRAQEAGQMASIIARWIDRRGQAGPLGAAVQMRVMGNVYAAA